MGQKGIHKRHKKVFYFNENENDISDLWDKNQWPEENIYKTQFITYLYPEHIKYSQNSIIRHTMIQFKMKKIFKQTIHKENI